MLGVCKIYPEMGPLDEIDKCYSFSVFDIRKSDIACGNCQNWIAADSVSIGQLVAMMFEDSIGADTVNECPNCYCCNKLPDCPDCPEDNATRHSCLQVLYPDTCDQ